MMRKKNLFNKEFEFKNAARATVAESRTTMAQLADRYEVMFTSCSNLMFVSYCGRVVIRKKLGWEVDSLQLAFAL